MSEVIAGDQRDFERLGALFGLRKTPRHKEASRPKRASTPLGPAMILVQRLAGLDIPTTADEACRPGHVALLIYDMQQGILQHVRDRESLVARVQGGDRRRP